MTTQPRARSARSTATTGADEPSEAVATIDAAEPETGEETAADDATEDAAADETDKKDD